MSGQASVSEVTAAIDAALKSRGGIYSEYSCKPVSWEDASRTVIDGKVSCWGNNVSDIRLFAKDETKLYTVRTCNWNEKLGTVSASDFFVRTLVPSAGLIALPLDEFLNDFGVHAHYRGVDPDVNLSAKDTDKKVSIRFQTTFLPIGADPGSFVEFATSSFNYNTESDQDPRNVLVLSSVLGTAIQQDGSGVQPLFHHDGDRTGSNSYTACYFKAEPTPLAVGSDQKEDTAEVKRRRTRRQAQDMKIGTPAMGERFNAIVLIQIPCDQDQPVITRGMTTESRRVRKSRPPPGVSSVARLSCGSPADANWQNTYMRPLPKRRQDEHVTITVTMFYTVAGGVPSETDVIAAIDDLERLYAACQWSGKRADSPAQPFNDTTGPMIEAKDTENSDALSNNANTEESPAVAV